MSVELFSEFIPGPDGIDPIVFLGALGTDTTMWREQHAALAGVVPLCFVDHRGHGRSPHPTGPWTIEDMADDTIKLVASRGWKRVHLVGLSIGGAVAQVIAATRPDLVASLSLVSTACRFGTPEAWQNKQRLVLDSSTAAIAEDSAKRWFTDPFAETTGIRKRFTAMVSACPDTGYAGCCGALEVFDSAAILGDITAPTLVVSGAQDPGTTPAAMTELHDGIASSRMVTIDPAAHLVNVEQSDIFNALVMAHVRRHN